MPTAQTILDTAEAQMRARGYNDVSYRNIADALGMKSASLHYHFASKTDLGVALVRRYAANFRAAYDAQIQGTSAPPVKLDIFIALHRQALAEQELICLCAVLGAERGSLPEAINDEVRAFFQRNINILAQLFKDAGLPKPERTAKASISALEGAMIVAGVNGDMDVFDATAELVRTQLP